MPQVLAIIGVTYRGADYVARVSIYGIVLGLAAVSGQLIGGVLVETDVAGLGWRGCFLINVPIGLAALALTPRLVPGVARRAADAARRRGRGAAGGRPGRDPAAADRGPPARLAAVDLGLARRSRRVLAGVLPPPAQRRRGGRRCSTSTLFRERAFSAGLATQLFLACAQASFFVYLALYLQLGRGLGPLQAGLVFTILAVAYVAASGPAPQLAQRFGRTVLAVGGASLAVGLALLALAVAEIGDRRLAARARPGLRSRHRHRPVLHPADLHRPRPTSLPARAGRASGALSTAQQIGFALGVAVTGVIYFGSADAGIGHAFELSLIQLAVVSAGIVAASRLLPARPARV